MSRHDGVRLAGYISNNTFVCKNCLSHAISALDAGKKLLFRTNEVRAVTPLDRAWCTTTRNEPFNAHDSRTSVQRWYNLKVYSPGGEASEKKSRSFFSASANRNVTSP